MPCSSSYKMRAKTLQISWHPDVDNNNSPILTVDVHPTLPLMVTGGADSEIKVYPCVDRWHEICASSHPLPLRAALNSCGA